MTAAVSLATKAAGGAAKKATSTATKAKPSGARAPRGARAGAGRPATTAAEQRAGIQAIKDARLTEPASTPATETASPSEPPSLPSALTDDRGAPSWWGRPDGVRTANTGGGFLLGIGAWVLTMSYLRGGSDGVKKLLKAKFFNEVE